MPARLTPDTYAVAWDDPAEVDGRIGGGPFRARLQVNPDGTLTRWNGFVCPHFERAEIDRYVAFIDSLPEPHDYGRVAWEGDTLVMLPDPQHDEADRIEPTGDGLYPLGAFGWTWSVCEPDVDPDELTQDEAEAAGVDGRDGHGAYLRSEV